MWQKDDELIKNLKKREHEPEGGKVGGVEGGGGRRRMQRRR